MEANDITAAPGEKRAPTTTTPLDSSPSSPSASSPSHKRQRLDSTKPTTGMDSSADFISLDVSSDGEDEEATKEECINSETISKAPLLGSTESSTPVTTNGSGTEEKDDEEDGGVKEKTLNKRRKRGVRKQRKPKVSATEVTAEDMKEQPEPQSLKVGEDSSDQEDGGTKIAPTNGSRDPKGADSESEVEEDKDSFTRRALEAKEPNGLQASGDGKNEEPEAVETAVVTAVDLEVTSANLSSGVAPVAAENDAEAMTTKDKRRERRREKDKARKKQRREERKAARKAARKAQIDVAKGGEFGSLPDGKDDNNEGDEAIELSSDDDDDEGLEINVDMDMGNLEDKKEDRLDEQPQAKNNVNSDEAEAAGPAGGNAEGPSDNDSESSDDRDTAFVDQGAGIKQRKYYTAFTLPPFHIEESRPLFAPVGTPDFKSDMVQERKAIAPGGVTQSKRICNICTMKGHSEDKCEYLKCKYCGSWNKHFSHACPDAERDDEPRVKEKWRRIPFHFHKSTPPPSTLPVACYNCAGNDHFGDDCPRIPPLSVPGSFSLTDINTNTYATQDWLLEFSDKLVDLESKGWESKAKYGIEGTKMTVQPAPDPFKDLRRFDDPLPKRPPPVGPARNGGRENGDRGGDSYKPRGGPRSNAGSYRTRSPVRDPVFDRYREPRELLPPRPSGLPQRPRSRSPPPRYRSGGGGGGGGGGGHRYGPPADYYNRPPHPGSRGGSGSGSGGYNGSRAYESRSQPPLPNEPLPRGSGGRREPYRPMPSSAKGNWMRYKT